MTNLLNIFIEHFIVAIDVIAVFIILVGVIKSLIYFVDGKPTNPGYVIGKALDLGLRYLMVGEVLRSVTTHEAKDLYALALILAIRIVIVYVNQKEMDHELQIDLEEAQLLAKQCEIDLAQAKLKED